MGMLKQIRTLGMNEAVHGIGEVVIGLEVEKVVRWESYKVVKILARSREFSRIFFATVGIDVKLGFDCWSHSK